jgi:hypothetical protein
LGERLLCKQEVIGSIPFTSTISPQGLWWVAAAVTRLRREQRGAGRGSEIYSARCGSRHIRWMCLPPPGADGVSAHDRGSSGLPRPSGCGGFFDRVKRECDGQMPGAEGRRSVVCPLSSVICPEVESVFTRALPLLGFALCHVSSDMWPGLVPVSGGLCEYAVIA